MPDVLVAQDPVLRARAFLKQYFPRVEIAVPAKWAFKDLLIVLSDTGGSGVYDRVLSESLLTVEVSHPRVAEASLVARKILGLLQAWPDLEAGVYWRREVGRPAYQPDDDTDVPSYIFTVALAFRSDSMTVDPL